MIDLLVRASLILLGVVALYLVILGVFRVPKGRTQAAETKGPAPKGGAHGRAAAIAAALAYLESEAKDGVKRISVTRTKGIPSLWCAAGRQNLMGGRRSR
jgi:hypothetical protein